MDLKATLLGYRPIGWHERFVPQGECKTTYSFEEAIVLVKDVLRELDVRFATIFNHLLRTGQIDVFPKAGKAAGAFNWRFCQKLPLYVMLNFTGRLEDVVTLAHELGHAINAVLTDGQQNPLHADIPTSMAEVASTFVQDFVITRLLRTADEQSQLTLLLMQLDAQMGTVFHQASGYGFELAMHESFRTKGHLSADELGKLFVEHLHAYMGEAVDSTDAGIRWMGWPHLRQNFYIYTYAGGVLISKAMQNLVLEDPANIAKVIAVLSAGNSASPKNILAQVGVDLANPDFWRRGLDQLDKEVEDAKQMARNIGKLA